METPTCSALATRSRCRVVRRTPKPGPSGKVLPTDDSFARNRTPRKATASFGPRTTPSLRSARTPSGINPSPQVLSIGNRSESAIITRKPFWRAAIPVASPAGPPPTMNTSVSMIACFTFTTVEEMDLIPKTVSKEVWSPAARPGARPDFALGFGTPVGLGRVTRTSDIHDAPRQAQRLRPECVRGVHCRDHCSNTGDEPIHLPIFNHQRRRHFEDHETVSANLSENALIAEQAHHQDLAEHSGMDFLEGLEGNSRAQLAGSLEFDSAEQAQSTNFLHHFILRKLVVQTLAESPAHSQGSCSELFLVEDVQRGQAGAHRQAVLTVSGGVDDRAFQRVINGVVDRIRHQQGAARDKPTAQSLGQYHHVRIETEVMGGKKPPRSIEARLNFVEDE